MPRTPQQQDARHDLRLELRIKNLRLWEATAGKHGSVAAFCREYHISEQSRVGGLITLQISPYNQNYGGMLLPRPIAIRLSEVSGIPIEELFPPDLYGAHFPKLLVTTANSMGLIPLLEAPKQALMLPSPDEAKARSQAVELTLRTLNGRQRAVVEKRYGLDGGGERTCSDVAKEIGVSPARVHQIETKALRQLRHPRRSRLLREFA